MGRIKILPPVLVNQIAAGECIERPASIVKELVENSLDAGATNITIDVEDAGNRLIRVSDNGCGMEVDDLPTALLPHATSKLNEADDLWNIRTLGFRGEALASIASVAEVSIKSAVVQAPHGYQIETSPDQLKGAVQDISVRPIGMVPGTIIEVRNLFFNVPGRRKFLKSVAAEMGCIKDMVVCLALACPSVAFSLSHNHHSILSLHATNDIQVRIQELLSISVVAGSRDTPNYKVHAYLALPSEYRGTSKWQFCYINGRFVRDQTVLKALQQGYKDYLEPKHFAIAFLYLTITPNFLDVNVHPTKSQVRHRFSQEVFDVVYKTVATTLRQQDLVTPIALKSRSQNTKINASNMPLNDELAMPLDDTVPDESSLTSTPTPPTSPESPSTISMPSAMPFIPATSSKISPSSPSTISMPPAMPSIPATSSKISPSSPSTISMPPAMPSIPATSSQISPASSPPAPISKSPSVSPQLSIWRDEGRSYDTLFSQDHQNEQVIPKEKTNSPQEQKIPPEDHNIPDPLNPKEIFQVDNTYLVMACRQGLVIIDQHALHEIILYEQLKTQFEQHTLAIQPLLFPEPLRLSGEEMSLFIEHQERLRQIGIEAKITGDILEITGIPASISQVSPSELVQQLLRQLENDETLDIAALVKKWLATMACKAAVKAGDILNHEQILSLLEARHQAKNSFHCPHGRPTTIKITIPELEKFFHRR